MQINDPTPLAGLQPEDVRHDPGAQLRDQFRVLREHSWLIILCVILTAGGALAYSLVTTPEYAATSRLLVQRDDLRSILTQSYNATEDPQRAAATDLKLLTLPAVAQRVARKVSFKTDTTTLLDQVDAAAEGNSRLLSITATDTSPRRAAEIANAFASEYVAFRAETASARYRDARRQVLARLDQVQNLAGDQSQQVQRLQEQADSLELLASQSSDADVVQAAGVPDSAVAPKPVRNTILGVIFGLLLGVGLAFLRDKLDQRVKKEEHVRNLFPNVPVVASIPTWNGGGRRRLQEIEGFRSLQTNLSFLSLNGDGRSLLVTSATPGEGKSTTAVNLALAMAERDRAALLVEADLRRPGLSRLLGTERHRGLSNVLNGSGVLDEYREHIIVEEPQDRKSPVVLTGDLDFLPAGTLPPNPQALLSGKRLEDFFEDARNSADTVIIDGTPIGTFSDMLPVATRVDGVILVVRLYHSRRDTLRRLSEHLAQNSVYPVGIVLFGASAPTSVDSYYYAKA